MARDTAGFTWPPGREDKVESEGGVQDGRNIRGGGSGRGATLLCAKRRNKETKERKERTELLSRFSNSTCKNREGNFQRQTGNVSVSEKKPQKKHGWVSFVHDKQSRASAFTPSLHPATREQPGINGVCRTVSAPGCVRPRRSCRLALANRCSVHMHRVRAGGRAGRRVQCWHVPNRPGRFCC